MQITLPYGKSTLSAVLPDGAEPNILHPNAATVELTGVDEVRRSLENPIASPRLCELARGKSNVVVIASDCTRPCPSYKILPSVMDELMAAGVELECITVVFAVGSHRRQTSEEMRALVGDAVFSRIRCIDADTESDRVHMGVTSRGTPVDIFGEVARADLRILTGNIEYHYFAGYSGGVKAIMPGVSTREAIQCNHRHMVEAGVGTGILDGNPVRMDIEEAGQLCPADFIVNVILDEHKEIIRCVSGHPVKAHREGAKFLDSLYRVKIPRRADIVIASAGGFPKDRNMYQAQKALDNASRAVRDGGVIIWAAECSEGLGEPHFEQWMTGHEKSSDMIEHIRGDFVLGGHKAAAIAMVLERARVILVSSLEAAFVRKIFLEPAVASDSASMLTSALDRAAGYVGAKPSIIVMPYGGSVLPDA